MSADLLHLEAVTEELKRLKRRAATAILLAVASLAVAAAAFVVPFNADLRAYIERVVPTKRQATQPLSPQPSAAIVEAQRLVVRDKTGRVRAELGVEQDDRAELSLRDPDGTLRAVLASADSGTGHLLGPAGASSSALLGLLDRSGRRLASLEAGDNEMAQLDLYSASLWPEHGEGGGIVVEAGRERTNLLLSGRGNRRIELTADGTDHSPDFSMDDAAGTTRVELSITDDAPALDLSDQAGKTRASLQVIRDVPSLDLFDNEGKVRESLEMVDDAPSLKLFDKNRKMRATLGSAGLETIKTGATEQTAESSLVLFDKEGKVMFRAPTD
jgi:hypothetical protein